MIQTCQVSCIMHRTYSISPYHGAYNSCACEGGGVAFLPLHLLPVRRSGVASAVPAAHAGLGTATRACLWRGDGPAERPRGRGAARKLC